MSDYTYSQILNTVEDILNGIDTIDTEMAFIDFISPARDDSRLKADDWQYVKKARIRRSARILVSQLLALDKLSREIAP